MKKVFKLDLIRLLALLLFINSTLFSCAQNPMNYRVNFNFPGIKDTKVYLVSYYGHDQHLVDSAFIDESGQLTFLLPETFDAGMYRIDIKRGTGLDFIFNHEDIDINTNQYFWLDSVVVIKSAENKIFYEYIQNKSSYGDRLSLLEPLVMYYPQNEDFYGYAEKEYLKLEVEWKDYLETSLEKSQGTLAEIIIRWNQLPDIRVEELNAQLREFYRNEYFKDVYPEDTLIIYTPILPVKIIDFLSLYVLPGASRDDQGRSFIEAVDAVMKWTDSQKLMQEAIINYLIEGFQAYGFEDVITHIVEKYVVDQSCVSDQEESVLKQRIEGFKRMAVGNRVADFNLPDINGSMTRLSGIKGEYRLIIFWASWCPHCNAMLQELTGIYEKYTGKVEFVGISIDEDREEWKSAVSDKKLPWINLCDLRGWEGPVTNDYYIYATPTLFLVDKDMKIKAKPTGVGELEAVLRGL